MHVLGTQSLQCRLQGTVVSIVIVFVLDFFVFVLFRFFRFSFVLVFIIFSFLSIFVLVFVNENHTDWMLFLSRVKVIKETRSTDPNHLSGFLHL